jgi:hypothetical protein
LVVDASSEAGGKATKKKNSVGTGTASTASMSSSSTTKLKAGKGAGVTPAGAPSKPKPAKIAPAKPMTFKQVEEKQKDSRQKFRFKNSEAVTKTIQFKDKTDISYLACPHEEGDTVCEKKVSLNVQQIIFLITLKMWLPQKMFWEIEINMIVLSYRLN